MKYLTLPLIAVTLAFASPAVAKLSPAEQKISATVETEYERSIAFLEKMVNQNSGTMNFEGVKTVHDMVRAELEPLGFSVEWKPITGANRSGHLIATHKGNPKNKRMLLIGHLDTVYEKDSPFQRFKRMKTADKDDAEGPGAGDDKGGIAVIVSAVRAMKVAGTLKGANLEIHLTGDEEDAGEPLSISRSDLVNAGKRNDVALDFEGLSIDNGKDMGSIARRSSNSWTLIAKGKTGHSSGIFRPSAGDGAIFELARIIARFRNDLPEPNLTFNVGLIAGGNEAEFDTDGVRASAKGKTNIIPGIAIAKGDFRTLSEEQTVRVKAKMQAIVAAHAPVTSAQIAFDTTAYPAMAPTDGNRALLGKLNMINRDLGLSEMEALDPLKRGAGDISFVANDLPGLVGLGPSSRGDHAPGETVDLNSIKRQAKRAAILMSRIAKEVRTAQ